MPITIACDCGRALRLKDEMAGRKFRCPSCSDVLVAPKPKQEEDPEEEALKLLLADSGAESSSRRPERSFTTAPAEQEPSRAETAPPPPKPPPPAKKEQPRKKSVSRQRDSEGSRFSIAVNPEVLTGLGMMVGAAVWFFVGLAAGWIFYYPPILFMLGVGAVIRGFKGG